MPKRANFLKEQILLFSNMQEAFLRAAKGKQSERKVVEFRDDLDNNLLRIANELRNGSFKFGRYHFFDVYDPKKRTICAASFPERVVFHAIMRVCHPFFENHQIDDSYASRIGRGQYAALDRAKHFAKKYQWFAKLDIRKYFFSINHQILYRMLCLMFKDSFVLDCFRKIIDSYSVTPGHGLPIGNLTSQYFANHYLTCADRYMKETMKVPGMVRYMDDTLLFASDKNELLAYVDGYRKFVTEFLDLQVHPPIINRTHFGVPFLGYVVYGTKLRLNQRSRHRYRTKTAHLQYAYEHLQIPEMDYHLRMQCLDAFIEKADTKNFILSLNKWRCP